MGKIENLEVGQIIKNYKVLCELLEVKPTLGKGREYHMREFERYCKYHKDGQKFIIDEVYEVPLEKIDGRQGGNHTKYETLMDNIIINKLLDNCQIEASKSELFKNYIELFTEKYNDLFISPENFSKKYNLGKGVTNEYLEKLNYVVKTCLHTALNRLQRQGIIKWSLDLFVKCNPDDCYADEALLDLIKKKEAISYVELNIKPMARSNIKVNKKFKSLVCNYVNEKSTYNIYNYWKIYNVELISEDIEEQEEDIEELKNRIANSICDCVKNKKMVKKKVIGRKEEEEKEFYYPYAFEKYEEQLDKLNKLIFGFESETKEDTEFLEGFPF